MRSLLAIYFLLTQKQCFNWNTVAYIHKLWRYQQCIFQPSSRFLRYFWILPCFYFLVKTEILKHLIRFVFPFFFFFLVFVFLSIHPLSFSSIVLKGFIESFPFFMYFTGTCTLTNWLEAEECGISTFTKRHLHRDKLNLIRQDWSKVFDQTRLI